MEVDVEVFVMLTMIIVLRARVLQGATCETHLNLNLAKPAETGTRYKQRFTRVIIRHIQAQTRIQIHSRKYIQSTRYDPANTEPKTKLCSRLKCGMK